LTARCFQKTKIIQKPKIWRTPSRSALAGAKMALAGAKMHLIIDNRCCPLLKLPHGEPKDEHIFCPYSISGVPAAPPLDRSLMLPGLVTRHYEGSWFPSSCGGRGTLPLDDQMRSASRIDRSIDRGNACLVLAVGVDSRSQTIIFPPPPKRYFGMPALLAPPRHCRYE